MCHDFIREEGKVVERERVGQRGILKGYYCEIVTTINCLQVFLSIYF